MLDELRCIQLVLAGYGTCTWDLTIMKYFRYMPNYFPCIFEGCSGGLCSMDNREGAGGRSRGSIS